MSRTLKLAGVHLALIAMMLRALLPAGWMPNTVGTSLTICTLSGPVHITLGASGQPVKQKPAPDDGRHHEVCPFAAASHVATPAPAIALGVPATEVQSTALVFASSIVRGAHRHTPQSPRAPPPLV